MSSKPVQPDAKEGLFLLHVILNMEGKPKVDWEKVATATGLKNASTANTRFGQIKKKLAEKAGVEMETPTPKSRKRKVTEGCETPSGGKKTKKEKEWLQTPVSYTNGYDITGSDEKGLELESDDTI